MRFTDLAGWPVSSGGGAAHARAAHDGRPGDLAGL